MQQTALQENVQASAANHQAKAGSRAQAGTRRRAPLGDVSNITAQRGVGPQGTKEGKQEATKGTNVAVQQPQEQQQEQPQVVAPRTRSQTARAMQQQQQQQQGQGAAGMSMSSLLEHRSEQATSTTGRSRSRRGSARSSVGTAAPPPARSEAPPPPSPLPDIDTADRMNTLAATEYVNDIYTYYKRVEHKFLVPADYMKQQPDINEKMRAILIDWLVEVHLKFKLMPETLFLTVNLIDRFLAKKQVTRRNLQLVGVTAMLIASKYEEIWAPEVKDFVFISDRAYTREQIICMEKLMLNTLGFRLTLPTPYNFLGRYLKAAGVHVERQAVMLASYLVELAQVDAGQLKYSYSMQAAAAVYAALRTMGKVDAFPHALARHSGFSREEVHPCAEELLVMMKKAPTASLNAVFKKYSHVKFLEVSKMKPCEDEDFHYP